MFCGDAISCKIIEFSLNYTKLPIKAYVGKSKIISVKRSPPEGIEHGTLVLYDFFVCSFALLPS